ncbi:ribose-phosphate pyrophosphokinase-like domain-containing protein [Nocardia nova]|uniref:ribose-phosphate pyrophosphokinase-like domain-containing protein n=1 Tax=Nocardia nova TaxID=37330 RepID=UPI001893DA9A|nr:ribose-phosphate pyrophosphokinase-like domain-containing protein [Nocardia nova]MBF6149634.1 ribose-phosphate pyrophosphokinase-like domain-containing protein [Nocardia nova]
MTTLRIITGSANPELAGALANLLGVGPPDTVLERFPDGELLPTVENVGGSDVYLVQPTPPPVNDHLAELLLLLDACRRAHAARDEAGCCRSSPHTSPVRTSVGRTEELRPWPGTSSTRCAGSASRTVGVSTNPRSVSSSTDRHRHPTRTS